MEKTVINLFVLGFILLGLNACSTIEGAGKDLQSAGQVIQNEASGAKKR